MDIFRALSKASDSDLTSNLIQFVRQIVFMKPWLGAKKIWMWNMSYSIKKKIEWGIKLKNAVDDSTLSIMQNIICVLFECY